MSNHSYRRTTIDEQRERSRQIYPRIIRRNPAGTQLGALAARVARRSRARESAASIAPAGGFSMFRADRGDLLAGLIIAAVGGWFLVGAFDYRIGTAVRMGPG